MNIQTRDLNQVTLRITKYANLLVNSRLSVVLIVNIAVSKCLGNAPSARAKSCILAATSASLSYMEQTGIIGETLASKENLTQRKIIEQHTTYASRYISILLKKNASKLNHEYACDYLNEGFHQHPSAFHYCDRRMLKQNENIISHQVRNIRNHLLFNLLLATPDLPFPIYPHTSRHSQSLPFLCFHILPCPNLQLLRLPHFKVEPANFHLPPMQRIFLS